MEEEARPSHLNFVTVVYLCCDSYKNLSDNKIVPKPWKRRWSVSSGECEYFGAIYVNESAKQLVLVHRGASVTNIGAIAKNVKTYFKSTTNQMTSAMTCSHELKMKMNILYPGWNLYIAGHSLGSYLTDASIFSLMYSEPSETGNVFCKRADIEDPRVVDIRPYGIGINGPG